MWAITEDRITEGDAVGTHSRGFAGDADKLPWTFRMLDADRNVYYVGKSSEEGFAPLHDFGTPNAGCTRIEYRHGNSWRVL